MKLTNIDEQKDNNVGGSSHQSVSIDHEKQVVNVDDNNGWKSWNTVWDYKTGYAATRILSKKSCVVTKMNPEIMPDVTTLPNAIKEKQKAPNRDVADKEVTYMVSSKRITDLTTYGKNVEALCKGIPTYPAFEVKRECQDSTLSLALRYPKAEYYKSVFQLLTMSHTGSVDQYF
ncbi:hypothetical protein JRQ81_011198 [Phrynocephalus forsythii]|uniref:Gastrokine-1 n=1 Tax=Phrynocephalus forsythii TaxID=171643 RepID=A0A9Q0XAX2_9SAUR|nr:hypothetical protein JRQ81_011198 [Phrynocephalus forsythii]